MSDKKSVLWTGSVEFSGLGGYPEKMMSELLEDGIVLRRVSFGDGTVSGMVSPLDYPQTARTARRYGVRLRAGRRRGLYFTLRKYSRRTGLYVGFLAFIMLTSLNGSHVQDIEIISSGTVSAAHRSQVAQILEECGITNGVSSRRLNTAEAERRIMLEIPESAWVDVTCVGFRVEVALEMASPAPEMVDSDTPCNLISTRDAVVVAQTVREGTAALLTGSGVPKGGLLVSGVVTDGAGNTTLHHASADVIGEFTEQREFFVPYRETIQLADGEASQFRWLVMEDDEFPLFFGNAYVPDSVYSEETQVVRIFGHETSLRIKTGTFTRLTSRELVRSADDCISELERQMRDFEENFYNEMEIVSCEKTAVPQDDGIRLTACYTLRGSIAGEQEIMTG